MILNSYVTSIPDFHAWFCAPIVVIMTLSDSFFIAMETVVEETKTEYFPPLEGLKAQVDGKFWGEQTNNKEKFKIPTSEFYYLFHCNGKRCQGNQTWVFFPSWGVLRPTWMPNFKKNRQIKEENLNIPTSEFYYQNPFILNGGYSLVWDLLGIENWVLPLFNKHLPWRVCVESITGKLRWSFSFVSKPTTIPPEDTSLIMY